MKVYALIDTSEEEFDAQNYIWGIYRTYEKAVKVGNEMLEQYDVEEYELE